VEDREVQCRNAYYIREWAWGVILGISTSFHAEFCGAMRAIEVAYQMN
jgi:hypothetical protein